MCIVEGAILGYAIPWGIIAVVILAGWVEREVAIKREVNRVLRETVGTK